MTNQELEELLDKNIRNYLPENMTVEVYSFDEEYRVVLDVTWAMLYHKNRDYFRESIETSVVELEDTPSALLKPLGNKIARQLMEHAGWDMKGIQELL